MLRYLNLIDGNNKVALDPCGKHRFGWNDVLTLAELERTECVRIVFSQQGSYIVLSTLIVLGPRGLL